MNANESLSAFFVVCMYDKKNKTVVRITVTASITSSRILLVGAEGADS